MTWQAPEDLQAAPGTGQAATSQPEGVLMQVPLDAIVPNPRQPRRNFDAAQIGALARSISSQGVLQPLLVRPRPAQPGVPASYELVAGERRLRALRLLGRSSAPAVVRAIPDEALLEVALVENLQREQLSPIEEAQAYRTLLEEFRYTQETLARRVGKDRSTIANMMRLLSLPEPVQQDLDHGRLSIGHARALLAVPEPERLLALRALILAQGLSVRETETLANRQRDAEAVRSSGNTPSRPGPAQPGTSGLLRDPHWTAAQERLERFLGTRVTLHTQAGGRGSIHVEFSDVDDFNRLYELILGR